MKLQSQVSPNYYPEPDQQSVLRMGLHPLQMQDWICLDEDFEQFHQHKQEQLQIRPQDVHGQLDQAGVVVIEFNNFLLQHLLTHHSQQYRLLENKLQHIGTGISFPLPAETLFDSASWVQEDICLLQQHNESLELIAASLCSPSNWELADKLGRSVDQIHSPVPGYENSLATRVNKLLAALKIDKPVQRYNWSVQRGNELYWQSEDSSDQNSDSYYWRVERQTLLRLPETGAIVFGIRIFLHDFETMSQSPVFSSTLQSIVRNQSEEIRHYKGLDEDLLKRLQGE